MTFKPPTPQERLRGLPLPRLLASLTTWRMKLAYATTAFQRRRAMDEIDAIKKELMRRQTPLEVA